MEHCFIFIVNNKFKKTCELMMKIVRMSVMINERMK